jgi:hypothetical protein
MPNKEFVKIKVLAQLVQSILENKNSSFSGKIFTLGEKI